MELKEIFEGNILAIVHCQQITILFLCCLFLQNYNKSRIHSFRGAKDIEISLDDNYIFKGEIARYVWPVSSSISMIFLLS